MPTESRPLPRQLLRVVLGTPDVSDPDLLARFVASRDEDAFAEIVRRHGPMVLAVCRRVTGRAHDADDAFQAAFLVLARRAGHVARPELLANWLYGVACRTALEARAARRRVEDRTVPAALEPATPEPSDDNAELRKVIDEELARLPDKYRSAVVLCELEGLPRAAAAAQLGIPEGTLSSRLAHARKVLAERLARRGVTVGAAAIGTALGRDAMATVVTHTLTHAVVHAAVRFVPGAGFPPGVPDAVSSLTDGVLKAMLATRLKHMLAVVLLAGGIIGLGAALAQQPLVSAGQNSNAPLVVTFDPITGITTAAAPPKEETKKVPAKGIEDDDVPYASFPTQAVVRIEDGALLVRQRLRGMVVAANGEVSAAAKQVVSRVGANVFDPADVAVYDMKGNRVSPKTWKETFKTDVHVLISAEGKVPNPRELALFKADTLVVVLPSTTPRQGSWYIPGVPAAPPNNIAPALPALPPAAPRASTTPRSGQTAPAPIAPAGG